MTGAEARAAGQRVREAAPFTIPLHCPACHAIVATVDDPRSVRVVPWDEPADVRVRCTAQLPDRVCGERVAVRVVWRRARARSDGLAA